VFAVDEELHGGWAAVARPDVVVLADAESPDIRGDKYLGTITSTGRQLAAATSACRNCARAHQDVWDEWMGKGRSTLAGQHH